MTPYEAVYHHKPSYWLSDFGVPLEYASDMDINVPTSDTQVFSVSPDSPRSTMLFTSIAELPTSSYDVESVHFQAPPLVSYLYDIS